MFKNRPFSLALWRSLEAKAVSQFPLPPPLLDLGCGFGEFAGVLVNHKIEVGVDISKRDLRLALQNKKYHQLILADARSLPFADNTFQSIISISTLEHIVSVEKVLAEAYRVLSPGGLFIFTVPTTTLGDLLLVPTVLKKLKCSFGAERYVASFHQAFKHKTVLPRERWEKMTAEAGFKVETICGTITRRQIVLFELGLPWALPTQLTKLIFKKRLLVSPDARVRLLASCFSSLFKDQAQTDANILVVAKKNL
ncbi:hypothetical protein COY34_00020 [candidate division WWE3 bacterium CG_4_10_14_0_2_um_filter_42_8]|uniref:Methyltransferase type 11 domain-containing protein n=1 Tax=candidate division WWE3 bacterium CG_4_10_14_0_2_um_filter_42_8 TaxID=1975074 RepID=A0A2M7TEG1_UNCKA|nr:MAG: hypothetical protein COY34_00020 [candidate division WWE3 bacterium CG_4_10_14_0_2_um_filter_42_8]